jgi:hypothetical protein
MDKDTTIGRRPGGAERPHESGVAAPEHGGRMPTARRACGEIDRLDVGPLRQLAAVSVQPIESHGQILAS